MTVLDPARQHALTRYLEGAKVRHIARELEVTERTIYKWMNDPESQDLIQRAKDEVVTGLLARYLEASEDAAKFVTSVLNDPRAPLSARFAAARMVMDATFRLLGQHDLVARMQRLEAAMQPLDTAPGLG